MQRVLIAVGLLIALAGVLWPWLSKLPLGRLPGDILVERENVRIAVPIVTSILLSVLLTVVLNVAVRLWR